MSAAFAFLAWPVNRLAAQPSPPLLGLNTFDRVIDPAAKTEFITGVDLDIASGLLPPGRASTVCADIIRISKDVTLPGCDITLMARQMICAPGVKLSTRGDPAAVSYTGTTAPDGSDFGADGANGRNGGPGLPGGKVMIVAGTIEGQTLIDTGGGQGGGAESGGAGARGRSGAAWQVGMDSGGDGSSGGKGGLAGTPGAGGPGGAVRIETLDGSFSNVAISSTGGAPGAKGHHGAKPPSLERRIHADAMSVKALHTAMPCG